MLARFEMSKAYWDRVMQASERAIQHKIAQGQCREVTHGDPVKATWADWQAAKDIDRSKLERMQVTYRGQRYWTYAGEWQKATGIVIAAEDRAPLETSRSSPEISVPSTPSMVDKSPPSAQSQSRAVPSFTRNTSYAQVRTALLRDGWQPVISKDADECMEDDSRCEGRPEMLTCSGSGLAMCRFGWERGGQQLTICTTGEEQASFHSICE
ncbi:hypothetical protein [Ottowia oryzae]